jgi:hypothetical protein
MNKTTETQVPRISREHGSALRIDDFATAIIEGAGGLNDYERHELVVWPYSKQLAASVWTMRCLANPDCEGSDVALAAIMARRNTAGQGTVKPYPTGAEELRGEGAKNGVGAGECEGQ